MLLLLHQLWHTFHCICCHVSIYRTVWSDGQNTNMPVLQSEVWEMQCHQYYPFPEWLGFHSLQPSCNWLILTDPSRSTVSLDPVPGSSPPPATTPLPCTLTAVLPFHWATSPPLQPVPPKHSRGIWGLLQSGPTPNRLTSVQLPELTLYQTEPGCSHSHSRGKDMLLLFSDIITLWLQPCMGGQRPQQKATAACHRLRLFGSGLMSRLLALPGWGLILCRARICLGLLPCWSRIHVRMRGLVKNRERLEQESRVIW